MRKNKYPEHEKLRTIKDKSQTCGEFIGWLQQQGIRLGKFDGQQLRTYNFNIQDLLAEFFDIDQKKIEEERYQMLNKLDEEYTNE